MLRQPNGRLPTSRPDCPVFQHDRIRIYPTPGTATEQDVLKAEARSGRICELIDGTLVEKTMATYESMLAFGTGYFLQRYLDTNNLGVLAGEAGLLKILPGQIRAPDVSFIRWERLAGPSIAEALRSMRSPPTWPSRSFPRATRCDEMKRKLRDYFKAGVRLVWYIEPKIRTARAYTAVQRMDGNRSERFAFRRGDPARLQIAAWRNSSPGSKGHGTSKRSSWAGDRDLFCPAYSVTSAIPPSTAATISASCSSEIASGGQRTITSPKGRRRTPCRRAASQTRRPILSAAG